MSFWQDDFCEDYFNDFPTAKEMRAIAHKARANIMLKHLTMSCMRNEIAFYPETLIEVEDIYNYSRQN